MNFLSAYSDIIGSPLDANCNNNKTYSDDPWNSIGWFAYQRRQLSVTYEANRWFYVDIYVWESPVWISLLKPCAINQ